MDTRAWKRATLILLIVMASSLAKGQEAPPAGPSGEEGPAVPQEGAPVPQDDEQPAPPDSAGLAGGGYNYGSRNSGEKLPDLPIFTSILRPPPTQAPGYVRVDFKMKNSTKYTGDTIRLRCEITGDPFPNYQWLKNEVPVEQIPGKVTSKTTFWGSRLKIENLVVFDSGEYICVARNRFGENRTSAYLYVRPETNPNGPSLGSSSEEEEMFRERDRPRGGAGRDGIGRRKGRPRIEGGGSGGSSRERGFCQPYRGAVCTRFMTNQNIYVTSKYDQGRAEEKLASAMAMIANYKRPLPDECVKFAVPSLCSHVFPVCDSSGRRPKPRKICRDECEALQGELCSEVFRLLDTSSIVGGGRGVLPDCAKLPQAGSAEADKCIRIGIPGVSSMGVPYDTRSQEETNRGGLPGMTDLVNQAQHVCYNGSGEGYRGKVSHTKSGHKCKSWKRLPDSAYLTQLYPELEQNYCRNPGKHMSGPWCYVQDNKITKELCPIPQCAPDAAQKMSEIMMILIPCIAIPVFLALLFTIVYMCRRSKRQAKGKAHPGPPRHNMELSPLNTKNVREFNMSSIRFIHEMGDGTYGKVYKGELIGMYGETSITPVAIKSLKDGAGVKDKTSFRGEIEQLCELRHPNVVCLLGICIKEQPNVMLFEFMTHGDLHEFLTIHSPHSDITITNPDGGRRTLDYPDSLYLCVQIAAGMEYLAAHHYVHKDLSARNILVGDNMSIKISNFGVARAVYAADYYRVQSKSSLPVRWMPPESILYGKFSIESDIWSYGVVLWEVFSFGLQPYYGYSNQEVMEMIRARQILPCPDECPARMYNLMIETWHDVPQRRPSFTSIHMRLRQWQGETMANHKTNLSIAHSQSGHSSSTHNSAQSHPSQQSTGPSNTTATTNMTNSSLAGAQFGSAPGQNRLMKMPPGHPMNPMSHGHVNPMNPGHINPVNLNRPVVYPVNPGPPQLQAHFRQPSPPHSVSSLKSSGLSDASSSIGYKSGGEGCKTNQNTPLKVNTCTDNRYGEEVKTCV